MLLHRQQIPQDYWEIMLLVKSRIRPLIMAKRSLVYRF